MNATFLWRRGLRLERLAAALVPQAPPSPPHLTIPIEDPGEPYGHKLRVEAHEPVRRHQLLALGVGLAPSVHSPVAGTVKSVGELALRPDGTKSRAIVIAAAGEEAVEATPELRPLSLSADEILGRLGEAGVYLRGARPTSLAAAITSANQPTAFLSATGAPVARPLSHLVVRFADVDPSLATVSAAAALAEQDPQELQLGVQLLSRACGAKKVWFALDKRLPLPQVERLADDLELGVLRLDGRCYPDFSAPFIAARVSGIEPAVGLVPVHGSGVLVVDIDTVWDAVAAVRDGVPVVRPLLTVSTSTGVRVIRPALGTPLRHLLDAGARAEARKLVIGGLMAGQAAPDLDQVTSKGMDGIRALTGSEVRRSENAPCMGCGACVRACPMRLVPSLLSRACEFDVLETAASLDIFSCIDCGVCGYVCPAGRSMVQLITRGKTALAPHRRA